MKKIIIEVKKKGKSFVVFYCLGCRKYHEVQTNPRITPSWKFNNDFNKPSLDSPLIFKDVDGKITCYCSIKSGMIKYFEKGSHDLIGMTIPMSDV